MDIDNLIENFKTMTEWEDRYAYIIELGKGLAPFPPEKKGQKTLVAGCASQVWMDYECDTKGFYRFRFDSDALIVKGLLFIIHALFDGKKASEIRMIDAEGLFNELGLEANLSSQRLVGLSSIVTKVRSLAAKD